MTNTELYLLSHEKAGLQVGDRVMVLRKAKHYEQGWGDAWEVPMNRYVGLTYEIVGDKRERGYMLTNGYNFPWFVLEHAEPEHIEIKLISGQTLKLSASEIHCGPDSIHLNSPGVFEKLIEHRKLIRQILKPLCPRRDLGLLGKYRVKIFPSRDLATRVRIGPMILTYSELEQVCTMLTQLRQENPS